MSGFVIPHVSYYSRTESASTKVSPLKIGDPVIESVSSVAKITICAIGVVFQAAKTIVKIPFAVVLVPFGYILEKMADCLIEQEIGWGTGMKKFANWIDPQFSKDVIMTVHLFHFTFNTEQASGDLPHSVKDVFNIVSDVVFSKGEYYDRSARSLWSEYIYGKEFPDQPNKPRNPPVVPEPSIEEKSVVPEPSIEEINKFIVYEEEALRGLEYDMPKKPLELEWPRGLPPE